MNKIKSSISHLFHDGFFHIVGAGTINKIISMCSGIIIVRVMSQQDYGTYSYIINTVNMLLIANGLGTLTGVIQYGCEYRSNIDTQKSIIQYGIRLGFIFNCICGIVVMAYGVFFRQSIANTTHLFIIASFIPAMTYLTDSCADILRVWECNREYGFYSVFNSCLVFASILIGAITFSVEGALAFRYIAIFLLLLLVVVRFPVVTNVMKGKTVKLSSSIKNGFLKFSLISCANNSIARLFYNVDLYLIGILIADVNTIAAYKVAMTIPFALTFITASIVTYIYPKFVAHKEDRVWLKSNYIKLLAFLSLINGVITVGFIVFAKYVIGFVFGASYLDSAMPSYIILMIGFFISSTFRIPAGNILDMLHLVMPNFVISIISGIANIVVDFILIKNMGDIGAAIATTSIYLLYGLLSNIVIIIYIKNDSLLKIKKNREK